MKLPEWIGIGVVTLAVGFAAYYATGSQSSQSALPLQGLTDPESSARFLAQHLNDVRSVAMRLGARAPTRFVVEFSDYQCPFCRASEPTIEKALEADSSLGVLYIHFPLSAIHPVAFAAAIAASCADDQGRGYAMHRRLMATTDWQSSQDWDAVANTVGGIDLIRFNSCERSDQVRQRIESGMELGRSFGLTGTPLFISERGSYSTTLSPEALNALAPSK